MPKASCEATNHGQSMRALRIGLTMRSDAQISPVQSSGAMMPPKRIGRRGNIGQQDPVEQPDEQRRHRVDDGGDDESRARGSARSSSGVRGRERRHRARREQVDRIPDAAVEDQAVQRGEHRHGDSPPAMPPLMPAEYG